MVRPTLCLLLLALLLRPAGALHAYGTDPWKKNEEAIALIEQHKFDGAIKILRQLEVEVPDKAVRLNLAVAYLGAAQQQFHSGQYKQAADLALAGREYNDGDARFWLLRGTALYRQGKFGEAESELNEAWTLSGDEPQVLSQLGQLYYDTDRMDQAIDLWRRARELAPDDKVLAAKLAQAEREQRVEGKLERTYSAHFILSYAENQKAAIGGAILDALEEAYTWAGARLGHYPERQVTVILYTQRQFAGLTGSPDWAAGLYDGKIRLPIGGLTRVDAQVRALLSHEFMHVMVYEMAGSKAPFWLNEGLAEIAGREASAPPLRHLEAALEKKRLLPLQTLGGDFRQIDTKQIGLAYEQSYAFTAYLIDRFGWYQMTELLNALRSGLAVDAAIAGVYGDYGVDLAQLDRDWRQQL